MVVFNPLKKEIDIKIVYYGPALCGKTTNLQSVHLNLNPQQRGELVSLATKDDRTLFFDFLPIQLDNIKGFTTRFHVYTVPGQVFYTLTRKAVLTGVDGVIFVADSQDGKMKENVESLSDLRENLKYYNKTLDSIPLVFQYNKRDLPHPVSIQEMNLQLNSFNAPFFEACALSGKGVMQTLTMCCKMVLQQIQSKSRADKPAPGKPGSADVVHARGDEAELPRLTLADDRVGSDELHEEHDHGSPSGAGLPGEDPHESEGPGRLQQPATAAGTPDEPCTRGDEAPSYTIDEVSDRQSAIEINQPLDEPPTTRGLSFRKDTISAETLPAAADRTGADKPSSQLGPVIDDGKRTCPRCSLKFKPNVKQCPICRISLVPDDKSPTVESAVPEDAMPAAGSAAGGAETEERVLPGCTHDAQKIEIISCGQPLKASSHAISIPVLMRLNPGSGEVKVELTISFGNGVPE